MEAIPIKSLIDLWESRWESCASSTGLYKSATLSSTLPTRDSGTPRERKLSLLLGTIAAATAVSTCMLPPRAEAGTFQPKYVNKNLELNGRTFAVVPSFVYNGTTYMPIWYVKEALAKVDVSSTWDGSHWGLTSPASLNLETSEIQPGSGADSITMNGTLVQRINSLAYQPPDAPSKTTFMPIWYVEQLLRYVNVASTWDGQTWNLKQTSFATKGQVTEALLKGLGIQPWASNQVTGENGPGNLSGQAQVFDDVPNSNPEWGFVQADVNWLYTSAFLEEIEPILSPDSATHFGLNDNVTWSSLDTQYRSHLHIGAIVPTTATQWYSVPSGYDQSADVSYIEPGANGQVAGADLRWASAVGLVSDMPALKYVTVADLPQLTENVQQLTQGYRPLSQGSYQVVYPPKDEYLANYQNAVMTDAYRNPNIMDVVTEMNHTQVNVANGVPTVSVDMTYLSAEKNDWVVTATSQTGSPIEVSWDYGKTWHSVLKFVSNNAADGGINPITGSPAWGWRSTYVQIKPVQGNQVNVQMQTGGQVYGQLYIIGETGSGLRVERPRLTVPTYWTFSPAWRPLVADGGQSGGVVTPSDFTKQYSQRLYVDGKALSDGFDVTEYFAYQGKGTLKSATYHLVAGTPEIEFQVANQANGDEIMSLPGTILTAQGVSPKDVLKYDATVGLWSS